MRLAARTLTPRQRDVLRFLSGYSASHGYPPTIRQVGDALGIKSTNGTNDHLKALERKGYIQRDEMSARALRITAKGKREVAVSDLHARSTGAEVAP